MVNVTAKQVGKVQTAVQSMSRSTSVYLVAQSMECTTLRLLHVYVNHLGLDQIAQNRGVIWIVVRMENVILAGVCA